MHDTFSTLTAGDRAEIEKALMLHQATMINGVGAHSTGRAAAR
jgi:hypothetical protein